MNLMGETRIRAGLGVGWHVKGKGYSHFDFKGDKGQTDMLARMS